MIQRVMAKAMAASVPGMMGSHFHAFDAVFDMRGSTTAYFSVPSLIPRVMREARRVGPWLASKGLTPTKRTNSADSRSACQKNFLPSAHLPSLYCSLIAFPAK